MTRDEEANIARCLDSVRWSDDVVVLDSYSVDRTTEIARSYGNVRVYERRFDDYGRQRNHGLRNIRYRNSWLLMVDADEVVEPGLADEVQQIASRGDDIEADVFFLRRKIILDGQWVKRNVDYNVWIGRFMRPHKVRFKGIVHEKPMFGGDYALLDGALEHHCFAKGVEDWLTRRSRYARLEARARERTAVRLNALMSSDMLVRRAAMKEFYRRLPAKWLVYFAYNFTFKFPYLDGWPGIRYVLLSTYSLFLAGQQSKDSRNA